MLPHIRQEAITHPRECNQARSSVEINRVRRRSHHRRQFVRVQSIDILLMLYPHALIKDCVVLESYPIASERTETLKLVVLSS